MGDNIYLGDRNGVRTPMQWSADRNAGFSRANPQQLYLPVIIDPEYHYEAINVETQQNNSALAAVVDEAPDRAAQASHALGEGSIEFLLPENRKVLAFLRRQRRGARAGASPTSPASSSTWNWTSRRSRA